MSKNKEIFWLHCSDNFLTNLDVSNNSKLYRLHCQSNDLSFAALNSMFQTLHNITGNNNAMIGKVIYIGGNPGTGSCNTGIAIDKGWSVESKLMVDLDYIY